MSTRRRSRKVTPNKKRYLHLHQYNPIPIPSMLQLIQTGYIQRQLKEASARFWVNRLDFINADDDFISRLFITDAIRKRHGKNILLPPIAKRRSA
eukprot:2743859-Ditylum_brightwellii.AAC.1